MADELPSEKEALIAMLMEVQTGHRSCRNAASILWPAVSLYAEMKSQAEFEAEDARRA